MTQQLVSASLGTLTYQLNACVLFILLFLLITLASAQNPQCQYLFIKLQRNSTTLNGRKKNTVSEEKCKNVSSNVRANTWRSCWEMYLLKVGKYENSTENKTEYSCSNI
jgi:hypothetical protein